MGSVRDNIGPEDRALRSGNYYSDDDYRRLHRAYCQMAERIKGEAEAALKCAVDDGLENGALPGLQSATVIKLHSIIALTKGAK